MGLYKDDAQVVRVVGTKLYVNDEHPTEHTIIKITKIVLSKDFNKNCNSFEENPESGIQ